MSSERLDWSTTWQAWSFDHSYKSLVSESIEQAETGTSLGPTCPTGMKQLYNKFVNMQAS